MSYVIGPGCSTCHYCAMECPQNAIRFIGVEYAIDPEKCTDCGICARVCPSGIISNPNKKKKVTKHDLIRKTADLVVLGAGGSGLVAAVKVAQLTGKKVIVLEKGKKIGGNTTLGHGFMLRYTKWHQAAGIEDTREKWIEYFYNNNKGKISYDLLKKATYGLSDMFDWLCEFGGAEKYFVLKKGGPMGMPASSAPPAGRTKGTKDIVPAPPPGNPFGFMPPAMIDFPHRSFENLKCTDHSMGPGWMGTYVVCKMMEAGKKLGVEVYTEHRAVELILNKKGEFTG
ncbi:MAG: FAD-binding protein, partial [Dehalococcoidia bacterium]